MPDIPKNEYANDLAVRAATEQVTSAGIVPSGFGVWLRRKQLKRKFADYDPDAAFAPFEERLAPVSGFRSRRGSDRT